MLGQRPLDALDRRDLGGAQALFGQSGHRGDLGAPGGRVRGLLGVPDPAGQGLGAREAEEPSGARLGVVAVGEVGLEPVGLEHERDAVLVQPCPGAFGEAGGVHRGLPLHARQRGAGGLGLDHADDLPVHVQRVVRAAVAGSHDDLADGAGDEGVEILAVHDHPTRSLELAVNLHPGASLRRQGWTITALAHLHPLSPAVPERNPTPMPRPDRARKSPSAPGDRRAPALIVAPKHETMILSVWGDVRPQWP